ncbi:tetratricopeptide repeat protein 21B-like [Sitophilus oryzae]|uniref:Tetratricopeptide repeat protein 21B-like n=1 Tax=Sitophilus oryzae TaxID=7048 RepID=A0A6J2X902_SITOR|nr:tetratricopeptide repeat protein 21B-like [Sitophilus oryzae]
MEHSDYFAKIFYHFHHKYFNFMLNNSKEAITKYPTNVAFKLYHSLALILTNRLEEAIRDLEGIREEQDVKLSATIALMYGHKMLGIAGRDIFATLDTQMKDYRKTAQWQDFYYSAFVLLSLSKPEKALDYVEKALALTIEPETLALKGWLLLITRSNAKQNASTIRAIFSNALQKNSKDILAILGYTECCLLTAEFAEALNSVNQAIVRCPNTNLALLQKMRIFFAARDWDQTIETLNRFNVTDSEILYALKYEILIILCQSGNTKDGATKIKIFHDALKKYEPNNSIAFTEAAKLFSTACARNETVLKQCIFISESALQIDSDTASVVVNLGFQILLAGKTKEAIRLFKSATKLDETCFEALLGLSWCEFYEHGCSEQLQRQIEYLLELNDSPTSLSLKFLQARASKTQSDALVHLEHVYNHKKLLSKIFYYSERYLLELDPDFCLEVVQEYLERAPNKDQALDLAKMIADACPGSPKALYLLARVLTSRGDQTSALNILEKLSKVSDESSSDASLLQAELQVDTGQYERAAQSLEACISVNFQVRENPQYHYVSALVDKNSHNYAEAIRALTTALSLVKEKKSFLTEKTAIYVELIDTLNIVGQTDESLKVLEEAAEDLRGSPEESRILLLSADNMLARKNIQGAIDLLNKITKQEDCYRAAKIKLADVFLKYRKDKYAFLQIYQDFVDEDPSASSYVLLGDAFMKVLEPDEALENYEKALKANPKDPALTLKMGTALVETHYFNRAVEYYKKAIKDSHSIELKLQLADLYLNLREYEKGEVLLLNELEENSWKSGEELVDIRFKAQLYQLLSQLQEKSGNLTYAVKSLKDAMDCQMRVKKRMSVEQNGNTEEVDQILVTLSTKLGEMALSMKNSEQAVNYYKDGLLVSPNNVSLLTSLAKLYMQTNYLELCQQTCATIFRIDPENEVASVMMADIAFRKVDFDMALFHFSQLVSRQPTNWDALSRLIEVSRRLGNLEECEEYINSAEKMCVNPQKEPGFLYCKAFYQWHSGNLNAALKNFNQVRQDGKFGVQSLMAMIEICLNPDDEMLAEQFIESDDIEYRDSRSLALKTAERLIKELRQRFEVDGGDLFKCRLLANFRLLATKEKYNIERALDDFVSIASQSATKDNLGTILGISTAHVLLKQQQRAKNQLKRVVKNPWTFEDADYLERCWLLLADLYVQSNKLDSASELINKVVQYNKACTKALEYSGYIAEKEHRYKEAANNYEGAWKTGGRTNPGVGYKLAYCLMKCKKYPQAIDTANEVLRLSPDYPSVRKDVLDKCINNLRI